MNALSDIIADDTALHLNVYLQCPRCQTNINGLACPQCRFQMEIGHGIVYALPPERAAHYTRFVQDYERIRAAEGRGSQDNNFYLALPYKDTSGRNSYQWRIRARSYDYLVKHVLGRNSQESYRRILDLGAGNCWMSFRLTLAGYQIFAVDLLTNDRDGLGAAAHYQKHLTTPLPRFQAEASHLPFQDGQFDAAIFNASFHYSEDYTATLREALRCVRSGGIVIISDTPSYPREESVEEQLSIQWTRHSPQYGFKWAMRPFIAKLRQRREPSQFHIYVARKNA